MKDISFAAGDLKKIDLRLAITKSLKKTGLVGEKRVKSIIRKEAYDTGTFLRSINFTIEQLPKNVVLRIGSDLEYAYYVEEGRKPGRFPNLDALVGWTGRKLKQEGVSTRTTVTFNQLKQLAKSSTGAKKKAYQQHLAMIYLVGRKIATKGIREKRIFSRIEDGLRKYFILELDKELKSMVS